MFSESFNVLDFAIKRTLFKTPHKTGFNVLDFTTKFFDKNTKLKQNQQFHLDLFINLKLAKCVQEVTCRVFTQDLVFFIQNINN